MSSVTVAAANMSSSTALITNLALRNVDDGAVDACGVNVSTEPPPDAAFASIGVVSSSGRRVESGSDSIQSCSTLEICYKNTVSKHNPRRKS
jgi:hypothetical protein